MGRPRFYHRCPCGASFHGDNGSVAMAVTLQLSTVGHNPRIRARAVTIYPCPECVRLIKTKTGRPLRKALAAALQQMTVHLQRAVKASDANLQRK